MSMTGISKYAPMLFAIVQKYRTFTSAFKLKKSRPISRRYCAYAWAKFSPKFHLSSFPPFKKGEKFVEGSSIS
jgi:hypothetical protein